LISLTLVLATGHQTVVIRDSDDSNNTADRSEFLSASANTHFHAGSLAADQVLEGWFVSDDGARLASTGILSVGDDGEVNQTFVLPSAVTTMELDLNQENYSGQSGTALLTAQGNNTEVFLDITSGTKDSELVHIHVGPCNNLGSVIYPLTSFIGGAGESVTVLQDVPLASLLKGNLTIMSHESGSPDTYTTCGNIPVPPPSGENIFADFNKFVVSVEPVVDTDPNPSDLQPLSATIQAGAMVDIRKLVFSDGDTLEHSDDVQDLHEDHPNYTVGFYADKDVPKGSAVGMGQQTGLAWTNAMAALDAANAGNLSGALLFSEAVCNIIGGTSDSECGDLNGDGIINDPGDGFGALNYVTSVNFHANHASSEAPTDSTIDNNARDVQASAADVRIWLGMARDTIVNYMALAVDASDNIAVQAFSQSIANQTGWALNGVDADGDGTIDRTAGEGGAKQAYLAAQDMGTYELVSPADAPPVGDPLVPQMAMGALILGLALLVTGGFVFYRSRRSYTTA